MESNSLELLHSVLLDMLVKFDKICEDNGLTYFLDSGTALGAVRHDGFIPWDDDVDVGMPREDYNRLLEIGAKGFSDNLFLQTYESDPAYMMPFAKLRLGNTFFPDKYVERFKYQGIYIDIFPFDRVPSDSRKAIAYIKRSRIVYFLSVFSKRDYPGKKLPQLIASRVLHFMPDEVKQKIHRYFDNFCCKYNNTKSDDWTCFCWKMTQRNEYIFKASELFPTKEVQFNGKSLRIVSNPHAYLTKMYGDYMILPPEDKRTFHLKGAYRV